VYVSFHNTATDIVTKIIRRLEPLLDAKFVIDQGDSDKLEKIANCDAFIAVVNSWYPDCDECKSDLEDAIKNNKLIIKLNLDRDIELANLKKNSNERIAFFDFYKDVNRLFING